jgi:hypothetical protein
VWHHGRKEWVVPTRGGRTEAMPAKWLLDAEKIDKWRTIEIYKFNWLQGTSCARMAKQRR